MLENVPMVTLVVVAVVVVEDRMEIGVHTVDQVEVVMAAAEVVVVHRMIDRTFVVIVAIKTVILLVIVNQTVIKLFVTIAINQVILVEIVKNLVQIIPMVEVVAVAVIVAVEVVAALQLVIDARNQVILHAIVLTEIHAVVTAIRMRIMLSKGPTTTMEIKRKTFNSFSLFDERSFAFLVD